MRNRLFFVSFSFLLLLLAFLQWFNLFICVASCACLVWCECTDAFPLLPCSHFPFHLILILHFIRWITFCMHNDFRSNTKHTHTIFTIFEVQGREREKVFHILDISWQIIYRRRQFCLQIANWIHFLLLGLSTSFYRSHMHTHTHTQILIESQKVHQTTQISKLRVVWKKFTSEPRKRWESLNNSSAPMHSLNTIICIVKSFKRIVLLLFAELLLLYVLMIRMLRNRQYSMRSMWSFCVYIQHWFIHLCVSTAPISHFVSC